MYSYEPRHIVIMCDNLCSQRITYIKKRITYIKKRTQINKLVSDNEI